MTLTNEEEILLAEMYRTEGYKVFKKMLEAKTVELGKNALSSHTLEYTAEQRGFQQCIQWLHGQVKGASSKVQIEEIKASRK